MDDRPVIYWHADDYGMTPASDRRIEACRAHGLLNSVSIVPNGSLAEAVAHLQDSGLSLAVHLNLVEGKALSAPEQIPLLADSDGTFRHSFEGLLRLSLSPQRRAFAAQVHREIRAQLLAFTAKLREKTPLRIDSHQHVHMIPVIFHELMQVIQEEKLSVAHLRIPAEPVMPFLREISLYHTYKAVNVVKQAVLNGCWVLIRPEFRRSGISTAVFCGILFSGQMDAERVKKVLPAFYRLAQKRGQPLELLFHPGGVGPGEPFFDEKKKAFHTFYRSEGRALEAQALCTLDPDQY